MVEEHAFNLFNQKLEDFISSLTTLKQKSFWWDNIISSIAYFITALSVSGIIAELFLDQSSVTCFTNSTNRDRNSYVNSYCQTHLTKERYFPLILLLQAALLVAPHYGWKVLSRAQYESFLTHAARVEILRESNTGEYRHHNYNIVKYLQREFSGSYFISGFYILKLFVQMILVVTYIIVNGAVFGTLTDMDITFECKDDNQLFENVTCVYPRKVIFNAVIGIDYTLIAIAFIILIFGLCWWPFWNYSKKYDDNIANFCYNCCINPRYCYKPPNGSKCLIGRFKIRDDFTFLLASLHSGLRRVFRTILIEDIITENFCKPSPRLVLGKII